MANKKKSLPKALSALTHAGFGLLLIGQALSLQGTWIQATAVRWLVLELWHSPFILGLLGAFRSLPMLLFSFWGGIIADRYPKLLVMIGAQCLIFFQAFLLGILLTTNHLTVTWVLLLIFLFGCGMAFEVPARQALFFELVGKEDITNALALHSSAFNLARFIGPAIAGLLMARGFMASCFYIKAASALVIIFILLLLTKRLKGVYKGNKNNQKTTPINAFKEAFLFVWQRPTMRMVLMMILCFSVLLLPYSVLLPAFGKRVLGLGAKKYGFLCAANGLGALLGAVSVALWGHLGTRSTWWWTGVILFPISLIAFSISQNYYEALISILLAGSAMVITSTNSLSLLQLGSTDELRGRIMGLFTTSFMGLFPLGSLIIGGIAEFFGSRIAIFSGAFLALVIVAYMFFRFRKRTKLLAAKGNLETEDCSIV